MNLIRKITFVALLILLCFGFYKLAELYSPGSYPNAEIYHINVSEDELINSVNEFKNINSKFIPPEILNLQDGRYDVKDHWYDIYFYYPDSKELLHVWIRPNGQGSTKLGLVSLNKGEQLGSWKDINKDFSSVENSRQKDRFEKLILNPIKKLINVKQWHPEIN